MKRLSLTLCLFLCAIASWPQEKVYDSSSSMGFDGRWSTFGDNYDALDKWIAKNRIYPQEALDNKEEGRVDVGFIVEKDGSLSSIEIKNSVSPTLDAEALRLASIMPKWKCAYNYGVPCRSRNQFSVYFRLPKVVSKPQAQTETASTNSQPNNNGTATEEKWTCVNGQKIYEGEYELFGSKGTAKYLYREGPNRSRIFDGHFEFSSGRVIAAGDFKDNHQVGNWLFVGSPLGKVKVTFNEDSRTIVGEFQRVEGLDDIIQSSGKFMRADDGHLNGRMIYANERKNRITQFRYENKHNGFYGSGEYNYDGREKGTWYYREGKRSRTIITVYDDNGRVLESYYMDNTTGDKVHWGTSSCRDAVKDVMELHWDKISSLFLRSTSKFY